MIHQAEAQGGFCVNHIAGVEKFRRLRGAHQLRQEIGSTVIGKKAHLGEILAERRFFSGDSNVRRQGDVHARARGSPVDRGDHRLRHGAHLENSLHAGSQ